MAEGAEGMARMSRAESLVVVQARLGSTRLPGKVSALYPADPAFGLGPWATRAVGSR
jgi:hypothetical protein